MSNTAIFQTGGKQYRVKTGDFVKVERLDADGTVEFDQVLMLDDKIGTPFVDGARVVAQVVEQKRGDKVMHVYSRPGQVQVNNKTPRWGVLFVACHLYTCPVVPCLFSSCQTSGWPKIKTYGNKIGMKHTVCIKFFFSVSFRCDIIT